ncbi:hypothetical protein [Algoriphagus halophilus]|uniref:Uncharacterized protein n=1 Tax=Algoriphagus halophilus TaxID=226505 RepID=A0A1N6HAB0_9BACT|nr:hypothetical protein [Algoriphagus halophilus]SIO16683.1 hypothetical protein SAMN05444394_3684 [Algoriphagus halophilus]
MDQLKLQRIIDSGVDFNISNIIDKAWEMFKARAMFHIGFAFLISTIQLFFTLYLEDFAFIYSIFLSPPLVAGFYLVANRMSQNEYVDFQNYFDGFKYILPLIIVNLITAIFIIAGLVVFILPGIYLGVGYVFSLLFVLFGGFDFWPAMEYSRKLVHTNWWKFFAFLLLLLLINIGGFLCLIVGLLVTIPLTYLSIYVLFEELTIDAADEEGEGLLMNKE